MQPTLVLPLEQIPVKEVGGFPVHFQDSQFQLRPVLVQVVFRHFQSAPFRQQLDGFVGVQVFDLLGEGDDISAGTASKAVKALSTGVYCAGRGFLRVKGAKAFIVAAAANQMHVATHGGVNGVCQLQLVDKFVRQRHRLTCFPRTVG